MASPPPTPLPPSSSSSSSSVSPAPTNPMAKTSKSSRRAQAASSSSSPPSVLLTWRDLTVSTSSRNNKAHRRFLLHNISGYAEPGSLLAIMGPSGCGKTTLLNTLAGRLGSMTMESGQILANGRKQQLSYGNSAYVTQENHLISTLTVYETLVYSAHLQLPSTLSPYQLQLRVQQSIREMGLHDCAGMHVGGWRTRGLSGGQKRRLSIAIETLKQPRLLFLDEPTSGLDSAAAFHVMKRLQKLVRSGKTLVVSIHQPSSEIFELFHLLCLLSSQGRMVYFGEREKSEQIFEDAGFPCPPSRNPADHFLWIMNSDFDEGRKQGEEDVELGDQTKMGVAQNSQLLMKAYRASETRRLMNVRIDQASEKQEGGLIERSEGDCGLSFMKQAQCLTSRSFTNMWRDVTYYWLRLLIYVLLSICVGTIFYKLGNTYDSIQARASLFIFITAFLSFMGVISFPAFIEDLKIFSRERMNGHYGVAVFVVANTVSAFPFLMLLAIVPGSILYALCGLHAGFGHYLCFIATMLAILSVEEALLMAVASFMPDFLHGMMAGAGIMGMYLLNGGFFRLLRDLPKPIWRYPVSYMSFHTWASQTFYNNEFKGLEFENVVKGAPSLTGDEVLRQRLDMYVNYSKWWPVFVLVCMAVGYRLLCLSALKLKEIIPARRRKNSRAGQANERTASGRFIVPHGDDDVADPQS